MERALKYEEIPDGVIQDSSDQVNRLHGIVIDNLEDPEDLLSPEDLDHEREREAELEAEDIGESSDPVALYLREIGSVSLLTREGEVGLAKEKEQGEAQVLEAVLSSPIALRIVLELGERVERGELNVIDVLMDTKEDEALANMRVRQKLFIKEIVKLRRQCRAYERIVSGLKKRGLPKNRRDRLNENLSQKKGEIFQVLKDLGLSKSYIEQLVERLKGFRAQLLESEQELQTSLGKKERQRLLSEMRGIE